MLAMIRQPGAQAEERLRWEIFRRLAAGVSVPAISCLPRQGAAEGGDLLCRSHAGIGERNGQRLAIQVILVLGNLQSMKSSQGDRAAES